MADSKNSKPGTDIEATSEDMVTIELKHHTVQVPREDFADPVAEVLQVIGEQMEGGSNNVTATLEFPSLFGVDSTGWRKSEFDAFISEFFDVFGKAQEVEPGESSGSGE